ncbi:MAG: CBS domain-containing protein [Geminicoccaceae bacterium]
MPSLKTAMTPFPYAVALDATLEEAADMLSEHAIHHLPVTDHHKIVGIVTSQDLMTSNTEKQRGRKHEIGDVCTKDVYVVDLNEPIETVVTVMAERHIGSAIVTRQGKLAGIFTWVDVCRCFGEYLRSKSPSHDGSDAA